MKKIQELRARLQEIGASLEKFKDGNLEDGDIKVIADLNAEFKDITSQIEALEKVQEMTAATASTAAASQGRQSAVVTPAQPRIEFAHQPADCKNLGFKNAGDFFSAVKASNTGKMDKRFQNTHFEKNAEDGGILVPEDIQLSISKKFAAEDSLFARTNSMPVTGNSMTLITDEKAPWTGGIQAYWQGEGQSLVESKLSLGSSSLKLNKVTAFAKVTDELLEDAAALEAHLLEKAPEALKHKVNNAIIAGTGVGQPLGILNSGFKVKVAKEGGQAADTVVARNIINMYSRLIPASRAKAVWIINVAVEPQLLTMKDDNGNFIYLAPGSQMNQTPYGRLMGLPVLPMLSAAKELGTEGDICLVDLSYYDTIYKQGGVKQSMSAHVFFQQDIMAYKWTYRLDGKCPFKEPVTPEYGTFPMSGIVTLEDR